MHQMKLLFVVLVLLASCNRSVAGSPADPVELAKEIDVRLAASWKVAHVEPSAASDDATFLRRVSLDVIGRVPTTAEVRDFLGDPCASKRRDLVDRLIKSPAHVSHFATVWRRHWLPQTDSNAFANLADDAEVWIATRLQQRVPYDQLVRELLAGSRYSKDEKQDQSTRSDIGMSDLFTIAGESKPENLAANTARAFLGVNLDCAQCHNHPFSRWTRNQFWQTAAFFIRPSPATDQEPARLTISIPKTSTTVSALFLPNAQPTWPARVGPDTGRQVLADWVTSEANPYFAKNAVNRLWAHFFGTGLVEPLDDLSGENAPSHPELLAVLARAFVASNYDLNYITKAIVLTNAYQLSTGPMEKDGDRIQDERLFSRMHVRGLTGEQLYDSLHVAAGLPALRDDLDPAHARLERKQFASRFHIDRPGAAQRSILQSLAQMNGTLIVELTDPEQSPILVSVADAPFLDAAHKVEALYLAALGRKPNKEETATLSKYIDNRASEKDRRRALANLFWALLNSSEFNTNH